MPNGIACKNNGFDRLSPDRFDLISGSLEYLPHGKVLRWQACRAALFYLRFLQFNCHNNDTRSKRQMHFKTSKTGKLVIKQQTKIFSHNSYHSNSQRKESPCKTSSPPWAKPSSQQQSLQPPTLLSKPSTKKTTEASFPAQQS